MPDLVLARATAALESIGINVGVLGATLFWVFVSLFFASEPTLHLAWAEEFAIAIGILLPWIFALTVVIFRDWKKANRIRISSVAEAVELVSPWLLLLVITTWLLLMLVLASYVMINPFATILLVLFPTAALGLGWLALLGRAAYRAWKAPNLGSIARVVGFLVPFPLAAIAAFALTANEVPMRMRFDLSEGAMYDHVEEFERSGKGQSYGSDLIGLYEVDAVYRHAGCVVLETMYGIDERGGFAYCRQVLRPIRSWST